MMMEANNTLGKNCCIVIRKTARRQQQRIVGNYQKGGQELTIEKREGGGGGEIRGPQMDAETNSIHLATLTPNCQASFL